MQKLKSLLGKKVLFFDGGTGSMLQKMGLKPGELPELWNVLKPENLIKLHKDYFCAGADIVNTNTFGASALKFKDFQLKQIVEKAIENADIARNLVKKETGRENLFVSFDIGPCGKLLKPMGDLDFEDAVNLFKKTLRFGVCSKIDCILIETMNDAYETKAAVVAAKEVCQEMQMEELPVFVTNVYDTSSRLLTGAEPETMVAILEGLGVDVLGLNCSLGPEQMKGVVERLVACSSIPVMVKPNAGLPVEKDGNTFYDVLPNDFASSMLDIANMGACVLGGCCGTTPDYIRELKNQLSLKNKDLVPFKKIEEKNATVVTSYSKNVKIGSECRPVLIGERINPTGKKKFKEALRNSDIPYIVKQGLEQEKAGAHVLDVNVGLPEIDEKQMMLKVICELQSVTDLPLQIDTSSADVMEEALRRYNGKPLVNSVNGKQEVMDSIFPLVKKYGGVVVALTLDESGIPADSKGRIKIVQKIYDNAAKWGIKKKDILIDALTMSVSSDINAARATLETVAAVHDDFGGNTVLGVSNVSFGLPNREFVNSSFFTLAMEKGLSSAIMNPLSLEMMKAWQCFCLLKGMDSDCCDYINFSKKYDEVQLAKAALSLMEKNPSALGEKKSALQDFHDSTENLDELTNAVIHGLKDDSAKITETLLQNGTEPVQIIDGKLIPGLDYVGKRFEQKTMYLPQLLMSAEAAKSAFEVIKNYLEKTGKKGSSKGTIIVATVHGDIHDIGKNIVKVLLENYDFTVIDLGKDVPAQKVVEECKKNHVELVGLSALMTTTVPAMKETVRLLNKECPWAKTCVGGAVMNQEYADSIGADFYGKDAMDTVKYAQKVFGVN